MKSASARVILDAFWRFVALSTSRGLHRQSRGPDYADRTSTGEKGKAAELVPTWYAAPQ